PNDRVFSYWDYCAGMFHKDLGMLLDLILASTPVATRVKAACIDRKARKGKGPSDHAPVLVDLDTAPDGDIGPVVPPAPPPKAPPPNSPSPATSSNRAADFHLAREGHRSKSEGGTTGRRSRRRSV